MATRIVLKIGDVFEIPLPDGRFAYCQFVAKNDRLGYLVRVFAPIRSEQIDSLHELDPVDLLFPPVFVGLRATARLGRWTRIGNRAVNVFEFPRFRKTIGTKPGTYTDWHIWDGQESVRIGKLPNHLRSLELECVWGDEALEERIIAGTYRGNEMY